MKDYSELTRGKEKRLVNNSGFYIKEFYIMELGHYGHREKEWLHPTASKIVYYNDTNQDSQYIFYKREQLIMYSSISGRDSIITNPYEYELPGFCCKHSNPCFPYNC